MQIVNVIVAMLFNLGRQVIQVKITLIIVIYHHKLAT
jgi:hypothetical protein